MGIGKDSLVAHILFVLVSIATLPFPVRTEFVSKKLDIYLERRSVVYFLFKCIIISVLFINILKMEFCNT